MKELLDNMNDEEKEIVLYGLRQLPMYIISYISILFIMLLMHMMWQGILYSIVYFSIRRYSGGYHAETRIRCYIVSMLLVIVGMIYIKYVSVMSLLNKIAFVILGMIIMCISPVDCVNKKLDDIEKRVYKKRTCYITAFWMIFAIAVPYEIITTIMFIAFFEIVLMCVLGLKFRK